MSTSKLQRRVSELLSIHLGRYTIRENIRPDWLITPEGARLELDFYIEELETAIEVQGAQHYIYVSHFHQTHDRFLQRLEWDDFKREYCARRGIHLIEIDNEQDAIIAIEKLLPEYDELDNIRIDPKSPQSIIIGRKPIQKDVHYWQGRYLSCKRRYKRMIERERRKLNRQDRIEMLTERMDGKLTRLQEHIEGTKDKQ